MQACPLGEACGGEACLECERGDALFFKEKAEREAKEKAEREAKEKAEREAKEKADGLLIVYLFSFVCIAFAGSLGYFAIVSESSTVLGPILCGLAIFAAAKIK
jgi:hypothetical protein